jgi:hypothetical protein
MSHGRDREVHVTFADGVRDDVASLVASSSANDTEALKRRIAELLLECRANPYIGELMGAGRHLELSGCRRVRFDLPAHRASRVCGSSIATSL